MRFGKTLVEAVLLKRYKMHAADVIINNKDKEQVFCPNLMPMPGCDTLGSRIWLSKNKSNNHKNKYIWELSEVDGGFLVDVNCYRVINLTLEALENKVIKELDDYHIEEIENDSSDLLLGNDKHETCFLSINHTSACDELKRGFFPEAMTVDGKQQLVTLMKAKNDGHRAVLLFCVQNTGVDKLFLAPQIDLEYTKTLQRALDIGVEVIAYKSDITLESVRLVEPCPIVMTHNYSINI